MKGVYSATVLHELTGDGVLTLTLNRPDRHNAWNREMEGALHALLEQASECLEVRVVVLTGSGRVFCPGLDTEDLDQIAKAKGAFDQTGRRPMIVPSLVPKPVICAINGACAGLGLITALTCDVRFAADDAKITTAFARRGLPAEEAVSWVLPRIVGHATALDLLLSSRVVLGAEAADIGLVHRSLPADELLSAALDYAHDLAANCSPIAMAAAKSQVYRDWQQSLPQSRIQARALIASLKAATGDFAEGVGSYVQRRPPAFEPYGRAIDYSDYEPGSGRV